ncbi:MAG: hypothetical protein AAGJ81_14800, partial [Verrucomicrobiota bacterium]
EFERGGRELIVDLSSNSTFTNGSTTGWTPSGGGSVAVDDANDQIDVTGSGNNAGGACGRALLSEEPTAGDTLVITADVAAVDFGAANGWALGIGNTADTFLITAPGVYTWSVRLDADMLPSGVRVALAGDPGGSVTISLNSLSVESAGALTALDFDMGTGYYVPDLSGNGNYALLSETGTVWTDPKTSGYLIEPGVDAYNSGAGNVELISSLRPILPEGAMLTRLSLWNHNTAEVTGTLDVKLSSGGSNQEIGDTLTLSLPLATSVVRGNSFGLNMTGPGQLISTRRNIALTASDPDATNLTVRADYIVLDPSLN